MQQRLLNYCGSRVVYLADEFYIMAGMRIPGYEVYEDFPQIENGVGLIAMFLREFEEGLKVLPLELLASRKVSLATGVSSYSYIKEMAEILESKYKNLTINVYEIKNNFFGKNVTVTGLVTGKDLISQLIQRDMGEELFISVSMLKSGEDLFLDGVTVKMLSEELKVKICVVENNGKDFIEKILGKDL